MPGSNPYLKPNRLAEVIALIQVLALAFDTHRSEDQLADDLQISPKSGLSWTRIAGEHPEFFRFNKNKSAGGTDKNATSLVARHILPETQNGKRAPLPFDLITQLIDTATKLHDKQRERADWWKAWIPILAVILTAFGTIYGTHQQNVNESARQQMKDSVKYIISGDHVYELIRR